MTTPQNPPKTCPDLWDAYLSHRYDEIPEAVKRQMDAAEALVEKYFGISPAHYVRANEYPHSAKLEHIVAALVLKRDEWETP